jgi:hypothetical protein
VLKGLGWVIFGSFLGHFWVIAAKAPANAFALLLATPNMAHLLLCIF